MSQKLSVIRPHLSSYFPRDFSFREKNTLESIAGIEMQALGQWQNCQNIALITDTHVKLEELPVGLLEKIVLIIHPNSGFDNFTANKISLLKAPIVIGSELRARAVAEYIWARLWQGLVKIPLHLAWDNERKWDRPSLQRKPILIVGGGEIGQLLTSWSQNFPFQVKLFDPFLHPELPPSIAVIKQEFTSLIKQLRPEVLILSCSLNPTSYRLINSQILQLLPDHAIIINAARGEQLEQSALFQFLVQNPRAQAFLDVFETEPAPLAQFATYENFHGTSHIAGVFNDLPQMTLDWEKKVLSDFIGLSRPQFQRTYLKKILSNRHVQLPSGESFFI